MPTATLTYSFAQVLNTMYPFYAFAWWEARCSSGHADDGLQRLADDAAGPSSE